MGYSVGIGLTNACNLACAHCYRDTQIINYLSLEQVKEICEAIPVDAMGMGTGENILNPDFIEIASYLNEQGVKISIASNGHSLMTAPEHVLKMFGDVELSIDYPTEAEQDKLRGPGNWTLVHKAIERCQSLGIEVSILATLMCTNFDKMVQTELTDIVYFDYSNCFDIAVHSKWFHKLRKFGFDGSAYSWIEIFYWLLGDLSVLK